MLRNAGHLLCKVNSAVCWEVCVASMLPPMRASHTYSWISSSETAAGVSTPRSVNSNDMYSACPHTDGRQQG